MSFLLLRDYALRKFSCKLLKFPPQNLAVIKTSSQITVSGYIIQLFRVRVYYFFFTNSFKEFLIITSYCRPNLEEFCSMLKMTSIVQQIARLLNC